MDGWLASTMFSSMQLEREAHDFCLLVLVKQHGQSGCIFVGPSNVLCTIMTILANIQSSLAFLPVLIGPFSIAVTRTSIHCAGQCPSKMFC